MSGSPNIRIIKFIRIDLKQTGVVECNKKSEHIGFWSFSMFPFGGSLAFITDTLGKRQLSPGDFNWVDICRKSHKRNCLLFFLQYLDGTLFDHIQ